MYGFQTDFDDVIDRRQYLRLIGAAGLLSAGTVPAAAHETDRDAAVMAAIDNEWEAAADERIADHRTADLEIEVVDEDGEPLDGVQVEIEMQSHEFIFGVEATGEFPDDQQYRETVEEYFNAVVVTNDHKWRFWEEDRSTGDFVVDWATERGLDVKGHVCLWGNYQAWSIPGDVVDAMGVAHESGDEGPDHDSQHIYDRSMDHIEEIISYYGDDIIEWEIVNEVVHVPEMIRAVEGDGADDESVDHLTADVLGDWYEYAAVIADEYGVGIAVNDYNVLVGPYESSREDYETQIEYLVDERSVDLDGIGFQSRFADFETLTPDEIWEGLERFADFGAGLRSTEFTVSDSDGWTEEEQVEYVHTFLKMFFSHPDAEQLMAWDTATFFEDDWSATPPANAYADLVFDEWWTDEEGETENGQFDTTAFLGDHDLIVSLPDGDIADSLSIDDPTERSVEIRVVTIDVLDAGQGNERIPVRIDYGDDFDPDDLDYDTVRLGSPEVVNAGEGGEVVHQSGGNSLYGRSHQLVHFEGVDFEDHAMIRGQTENGTIVVGFDDR